MAKKRIITALTLILLLFSMQAQAAVTWYTCSIVAVGVGSESGSTTNANTTMNVALTDSNGAFTALWIRIQGTYASEALATILTAKALGKKIFVSLNDTTKFTVANGFYIVD